MASEVWARYARVSAASGFAVATNIVTRIDWRSTIEQASGLLVKYNDAEELVIETELIFNWEFECVEHVFKKKPATKFRGNNARVVEYLLDRPATQACQDLCDRVRTRLPQEVRDMICSYLYKPLTIEVALRLFRDGQSPWRFKARQPPWIEIWGLEAHMQLSEEYCRLSAVALNADAFAGRWKPDRIPTDFVTRIEAKIHCDEWCTFVQSADAPRLVKSRSDLVFHLDFLLGFPPGTVVKLNLSPGLVERQYLSFDRAWVVDMIIPIILPTLDRYRTSGYVTHVAITGIGRNFVVDEYISLAEWKTRFADVRIVDTTNTSMLTSAVQAGRGRIAKRNGRQIQILVWLLVSAT
jgi:hypothetical protein